MAVSVVTSVEAIINSESIEWHSFKSQFGKSYPNQMEEGLRKAIFMANKERVEQFNTIEAGRAGYKMGLNHLGDLSDDEMAIRKGFKAFDMSKAKTSVKGAELMNRILNNSDDDLPAAVDWTKVEGRVSTVKDQGQCGSCWAFSATGALEGQMLIRNTSFVPLSEQNLVDCSKQNFGCEGGNQLLAWEDIHSENGIENENAYPYKAIKSVCEFDSKKSVFTVNNGFWLDEGDEEMLKKFVAKFGPVPVSIDASFKSFDLYKEGVYYDRKCGNRIETLNHAVLVVGYGTTSNGTDYWLVKNSWGTTWGENGYIRMARNRNNLCGIATVPLIPTF